MTKEKTVAIIQARLASTRLPGKVLKPILGKPMLWHIVNRVKRSKFINEIIIATSKNKKDKKIINFCKRFRIKFFVGPENDVLKRFILAARKFNTQIIVRITADCPLIDPQIIDKTIAKFTKGNYDYVAVATGAGVAKVKINKFPDGTDCEVFSFRVLETTYKLARTSLEKEHPTMFIWKNPQKFKLGLLESEKDYSSLRFTVDYSSDLEFVRKIYKKLYYQNHSFTLAEIVNFLKSNPKILSINKQDLGKEDYEILYK